MAEMAEIIILKVIGAIIILCENSALSASLCEVKNILWGMVIEVG